MRQPGHRRQVCAGADEVIAALIRLRNPSSQGSNNDPVRLQPSPSLPARWSI